MTLERYDTEGAGGVNGEYIRSFFVMYGILKGKKNKS